MCPTPHYIEEYILFPMKYENVIVASEIIRVLIGSLLTVHILYPFGYPNLI